MGGRTRESDNIQICRDPTKEKTSIHDTDKTLKGNKLTILFDIKQKYCEIGLSSSFVYAF